MITIYSSEYWGEKEDSISYQHQIMSEICFHVVVKVHIFILIQH